MSDLLLKGGVIVAFIALAAGFVKSKVDEARAEGRNATLLAQLDSAKNAHAIYVEAKLKRDSAKDAELDSMRTMLDASKASTEAAIARADSADRNAENAWREARDELDRDDYERLRAAFDSQDEALDECSLALKNCGTLTAALEARIDTLKADYREQAEFIVTLNGANEGLQAQLKHANKPDLLPWGIAAAEFVLLVASIAF